MSFKDHFSGHSAKYSAFRPNYPAGLFSWLSSLCDQHSMAWDCATGSGQAAADLADCFDIVVATDASANQIAQAVATNRVSYRVALAESSGLQSDSVDLITVAQALHWFDIPAFSTEADRVLRVNGILAVWTYGLLSFTAELDKTIGYLYEDLVGEHWPFERKMVESGYAQVQMPFTEIPTIELEMTEAWKYSDLVGYLNTWSAVKAYEKQHGRNPIEQVHDELLRRWGDTDETRMAKWPLTVKAWRKPPG